MAEGRTVRLTTEERDTLRADVVTKYQAGASIRSLASEVGKSYGFVHGLLVSAGVTLRGRGGDTRSGKRS